MPSGANLPNEYTIWLRRNAMVHNKDGVLRPIRWTNDHTKHYEEVMDEKNDTTYILIHLKTVIMHELLHPAGGEDLNTPGFGDPDCKGKYDMHVMCMVQGEAHTEVSVWDAINTRDVHRILEDD